MKKILSFFLCLILILLPLSSFAVSAEQPEGYSLNSGNKTYTVTTADGFLKVVALINAGQFNYNITLAADIDLAGKAFVPIVPSWNSNDHANDLYTGTFDGDRHTVSNMTVSATGTVKGLIAFGGNGVTVKNLTLASPSIIGEGFDGEYCGFVIANSRGTNVTVSNVHIVNGRIESKRNYVGGLIGRYDGSSNVTTLIENCSVAADLSGTQSVGGIAGGEGVGGSLRFSAVFRNIAVKGMFRASSATSRIGGIIGYSNLVDLTFEKCVTLNDTSEGNDVGGLTGISSRANLAIANCFSNRPFSGSLSTDVAVTVTVTNSAILNGAEKTDFFLAAPSAANAENVTATVDGVKTPCAGLQIPTVIIDRLRLKIDELFAENAEFLAAAGTALADDLSYSSALVLQGLQTGAADTVKKTFPVRLIGTVAIPYTQFDSLAFEIVYTDPSGTAQPSRRYGLSKVFSSINATESGKTVSHSALELGGDHIVTLTLDAVPATGTCVYAVTPVFVMDGVRQTGTTYTITFANGAFKDAVSQGTVLAPAGKFSADSIGLYTIVYASQPAGMVNVANALRDAIQTATGKTLPVVSDLASSEKFLEILVGPTNRSFSQKCYASSSNIMRYEVRVGNRKLQLVAGGPYSGMKCVQTFASRALGAGTRYQAGFAYHATELATDSQALTNGADIRVMSSNILNYHWGEEANPNVYPVATRCEIYAGVLLRFRPDFAGLQEADENWRDALPYYLNSMQQKENVGYTHIVRNVQWKGKTVVNYSSLIYRSDLYDVNNSGFRGFAANYQSSYCQRVGTYAKFTSKTDPSRQVIIVNSQWAHESDERILSCVNEESELVNGLKTQYPGVPIFCTGDFNSDISKKAREWEDVKTTDPEGYQNAKNRYEHFLVFVDQVSGTIASSAAESKGVLITPGGCRTSAKLMSEDTPRALDHDFIDHIVICGDQVDVLRHDTIRSNGCHVMTDHAPIYADVSLG